VPCTVTTIVHEALVARVAPDRLTEDAPATAVAPPLQVLVNPFGVATTRPAGRLSVKAIPIRDASAFGLARVNVSEVVPLRPIVTAPKIFVIEGGRVETVSEAFDVLPVPALVEVTCTLLFFTPSVVLCTVTAIVHEAPLARVAPDRLADEAPATAVAVPPQLVVNPLGVATTRPAGRLSVKATPVRDVTEFGLATVKVSDVVWFSSIVAAPNAFVIVGGCSAKTVSDAFEVLPVPTLVELTCTLLFFTPVVVPCTAIAIVQDAPWLSDAPERLAEDAPATAVAVPLQFVVNAFGVATTSPAGRLSVKAMPVWPVTTLGLVIVKVSDVVPFCSTVAAPKTFVIEGGGVMTVSVAFDVLPVPPLVEVTWTLLFLVPTVVACTSSAIVHDALAARVAPDRLADVAKATAVAVPPQVLVRLFGLATRRPAGKLSVKATPVSEASAFGLVIAKVRDVVATWAIVAAPNAFVIDGGGIETLSVAFDVLPVPP